MKSPQVKPVRVLQEHYQENLEIMLKNMLKDESLSDVTIHCKDGSVRAHRVILAASSPYFKKIFQEHPEHQVAFLLHGVPVKQVRSLVELMYRGSTQIPSDMTTKLCDIAEEFGMRDIVDENEKSLLNTSGRDTRFKGQKRVTVDFENDGSDTQPKSVPAKFPRNSAERRFSGCSERSSKKSPDSPWTSPSPLDSLGLVPTGIKQEPRSPSTPSTTMLSSSTPLSPEAKRRNNWALKQRKYKCSLCPASFKRASHLSRHQLVHTGERPYACDQCEKAFSRHDKLKHHIRKAHSVEFVGNMVESSNENDFYSMGHVKIDSSEICEEPARVTREDLLAQMTTSVKQEPEPYVEPEQKKEPAAPEKPVISDYAPSLVPNPAFGVDEDRASDNGVNTGDIDGIVRVKKGRGRPRKYPPVPRPLFKRPRGRPRLNQSVPLMRPLKPYTHTERRSDNYDITNMPFGDLEYLTKTINIPENQDAYEESSSGIEPNFMEPLVEIELDQKEKSKEEEDVVLRHNTAGSFLQNIGLLETNAGAKMEIGECTVTVSDGPGFT